MRGRILCLLVAALPALALDGVVLNRSTGKPAVNATVTLYQLGGGGPEALESVHTGAQGKFAIAREADGPRLLQTAFDGVTYNHMLPPGSPTTGLSLEVYNASKKPGPAAVAQHMVLLEPAASQLAVSETYLFKNDGKETWNDPEGGTLRFYLPEAAGGNVQITATAPQGMPIERAAEKAGPPNVYKLDFPIKPGETRVDLRYSVPYSGGDFAGRILYKGQGPTRLVVPTGVKLTGGNLQPLGSDPQNQASIYELKGTEYKVALQGTGAIAAAPDGGGQDSGPTIEQIMPKVWDNAALILGLAFGILALGFILLYRSQPATVPEGKHAERRRR